MAITLPLRSQTGLTLSLEPTEGTGVWEIIESFEQTAPVSDYPAGGVTGQKSGTSLYVTNNSILTYTRSSATGVVDGTYSWRLQGGFTGAAFGELSNRVYLRATGGGVYDFSDYSKIRLTFTVVSLEYAGSDSVPLIGIYAIDNSGASAVSNTTTFSGGNTYQLEIDFSSNASFDPTQAYLDFGVFWTVNNFGTRELTMYIDALEGYNISGGASNGFKVWNGSTWGVKPVKWYNGSTWLTKPLKRWNGSSWVAVEY